MRSTLTTHTRIGCKPRPYGRYARIWLLTWLALQAALQSQEHKCPLAIAPATNHHDSDTSHDVTASSVVSNNANTDIELTADTTPSLLAFTSDLPAKSKSTTFDTDSVPILTTVPQLASQIRLMILSLLPNAFARLLAVLEALFRQRTRAPSDGFLRTTPVVPTRYSYRTPTTHKARPIVCFRPSIGHRSQRIIIQSRTVHGALLSRIISSCTGIKNVIGVPFSCTR